MATITAVTPKVEKFIVELSVEEVARLRGLIGHTKGCALNSLYRELTQVHADHDIKCLYKYWEISTTTIDWVGE